MKKSRKALLVLLLIFLSILSVFFGYYFMVTKDAILRPEKLELSGKTVQIFDENDTLVQNTSSSNLQQSYPISLIPNHTKNAFIATEDKRFLSHNGFDVLRIMKATLHNLKHRAFDQGASTISQQLIKNTHLSQEKTIARKLKEWKLTRALEKQYTKQEILEKYLNVIYFGHNCFGIYSASAFYFQKEPKDLDLADSAILAGLIKSPNNYSPFKNPEKCQRRKQTVLQCMLNGGYITVEEMETALAKALPTQASPKKQANGYLHRVYDELGALAENYGFTVGGNVKIFTYLNSALQEKVDLVANSYTTTDKSVIVSSITGGIKAYHSTTGNALRLPGSLLKPLLVYAPCLEENIITPATPILDEKVNFNGYSPNNYDDKFHGYVSVRESVAKSLNIPAVKLLETLGTKKGASYLQKMGLTIDKDDFNLSLALGGMKNGFSLQQLISAYTSIANEGVYTGDNFIRKIVINDQIVFQRTIKNERIFSKATAFLTTDMLQSAVKEGTAKKLKSLPFAVACKTGTAGNEEIGTTDAYAISYTTQDIIGVWFGNADNTPISFTGGGVPCNVLYELNNFIYTNKKEDSSLATRFPAPKTVEKKRLDKVSYQNTHSLLLADENAPKEYTFEEWIQKSYQPLQKSNLFTTPSIVAPTISVQNEKVYIHFDSSSPAFYQYKIERLDGSKKSTLYFGEYIKLFVDKNVKENKTYQYMITPYYQTNAGKTSTLPTVYIPTQERNVPKDWWEKGR